MEMEFSFVYRTRGIIAPVECEERQVYYDSLEDADSIIKADLSKVFRQMRKGNVYLRVSTGSDTWTQKQFLCVHQSIDDIDNGIYTITVFENNGYADRKTSATQVKKIILDTFRKMSEKQNALSA